MARKISRHLRQCLIHVDAAIDDVLTDKVRMGLLAHPEPRCHQRDTGFGASEPRNLDIRRKRRRPRGIGIGQQQHDNRRQGERLPHRLQQRHRHEIDERPLM